MRDFEQESYRPGIPLRTRHNEVAPAQFECAPIFEELNLAVDHNTLLMDVMTRVAKRHNLVVLLHENHLPVSTEAASTITGHEHKHRRNLLSPARSRRSKPDVPDLFCEHHQNRA